jgi:hypothetical protein
LQDLQPQDEQEAFEHALLALLHEQQPHGSSGDEPTAESTTKSIGKEKRVTFVSVLSPFLRTKMI